MKTIYKKCSACNGIGHVSYVEQDDQYSTTPRTSMMQIMCLKCNGSGRVETDFFLEDKE